MVKTTDIALEIMIVQECKAGPYSFDYHEDDGTHVFGYGLALGPYRIAFVVEKQATIDD